MLANQQALMDIRMLSDQTSEVLRRTQSNAAPVQHMMTANLMLERDLQLSKQRVVDEKRK